MKKEVVKLTLPEPSPGLDYVTFQVVGDYIIFLYLNYDEWAPNPLEDTDGMGTIYSFHTGHVNYKHPDKLEEDDDRVFLSYFEHGLCRWGVQGTMDLMPDFRWDGVRIAGVWYPDMDVRSVANQDELAGQARKEWMKQRASDACDIFTQWCNGEVYFCSVYVYPARYEGGRLYNQLDDYRFSEAVLEDSYGCCYGLKQLQEYIQCTMEFFREKEGLTEVFEVERR